jgi:16S rRNA processing protein RimM
VHRPRRHEEPLRPAPPDVVIVAEITKGHGVRGAVRVVPVTDFPDHLLALQAVILLDEQGGRTVHVESAHPAGRFVVMKLVGIDTPEAADRLRGVALGIPASEVRALPPGQFYVFQIVGLRVRTPQGAPLGQVTDVLHTGSNDVYVVRTPEGGETLLPAVGDVIEAIDVAAGEIIARPPEWM